MKTLTRETYAKRLERVVEFLFDHLDDDIDLHRLAEEAHLSAYHFHRVYHSMTGETIADTLRRLRLHRAAVKLISSDIAIDRLAEEAGYSSVASFTRAFSGAYNIPPAAYRAKQTRHGSAAALRAHLVQQARSIPQELQMKNIRLEHRPAVRVAAMAHRGAYNDIGQVFDRLSIWAAGRNLLSPATRSFGIYYDDPAATAEADLKSDACLEIAEGVSVDGDVHVAHTPGGRCAVLLHVGPYSDLEQSYQWLFGVWLPQSGEEPADAPPFEEYLNDPRQVPPAELRTEVCLPLKG